MTYERINAEGIWDGSNAKTVSHAAHEAREHGYQFFIYIDRLFLIAYWRDASYPDFLPLGDIEASEIERFKREIEAQQ